MSEEASVESVEEIKGNEKVVDPFGDTPIPIEEAISGAKAIGLIGDELAEELAQGEATITVG